MRCVLPLLAFVSLAFAPAPFPKPERHASDDAAAMQGEWEAVSYKVWINTKERGFCQTECTGVKLTVADGMLKFSQNGRPTEQAPFVLDRSRSPRAIDTGHGDGGRGVRCGVYKLNGDTLTICDAPAAIGRPSDFAGDKPMQRLIVLKRKKP
jgi:uncharacterized protein (TIGR03067 family)